MKHPLYLLFAIALTLGVAGFLSAPSASAIPSAGAYNACWTDTFDSPMLNSRWAWIREDATHWSLTTNPGFLRITTQDGTIMEDYGSDQRNILVTDAPTGDYQITTKVSISPSQDYQLAGILIYQDDDNYLHLMQVYDSGIWMSFHKESGGNITINAIKDSSPTVYLRITRQDTTYQGYYSKDGNAWTLVYTYTRSYTNPKIGLDATNTLPGLPQIPADFDFFQLGSNCGYYLPLAIKPAGGY